MNTSDIFIRQITEPIHGKKVSIYEAGREKGDLE
jgi:hypothetical protein